MVQYKREIYKSQAKFIINSNLVVKNSSNQQNSYNLPQDFIDFVFDINNQILVEDANIDYSRKNLDGNAFILNNQYKLELAQGLGWVIGTNISTTLDPKYFLISKNKSNNKYQLYRNVYENLSVKDKDYSWFVKLYDNNLVGNSLIIDVDTINKKIILDVEMNSIVNTSNINNIAYIGNQGNVGNFDAYQLIYYGVPGTGKSYEITKKIVETYPNYIASNSNIQYVFRTTLHPEYSYYDFVGSIIPVVKDNPITNVREISYDFSPGIFTQALCEAFKNEDKKIFLVLEEMSRSNVASVFGDLFQLLDRADNGESEYRIKNDVIASEIYKATNIQLNNIYLPSNLYIYGSVNTSDQNVFVMDNAFKRRFEFKYIGTKPVLDKNGNPLNDFEFSLDGGKYKIKWIEFYQRFNWYVTKVLQLREDKQIGQFFIKFKRTGDPIKDAEYNYRQICNKLLQYMWSDIHLSFMSKSSLFKDVDNYEDAYEKFLKCQNIFCDEFIKEFEVQIIDFQTSDLNSTDSQTSDLNSTDPEKIEVKNEDSETLEEENGENNN